MTRLKYITKYKTLSRIINYDSPPTQCNLYTVFQQLDRFLWEHKVARKVKVFWKLLVGNFCQYHFCCTLIMGRRKFCARDWWNAEACWWNDVSAVVTLIPEKVATSWKEFPAAKTFRAAHTCRSQQQQRQRRGRSSSGERQMECKVEQQKETFDSYYKLLR